MQIAVVRGRHLVRSAGVVDPIGNRRCHWREQELGRTGELVGLIRNRGIPSVEVEGALRFRRGKPRKVQVLKLNPTFESMGFIDFGQVLGKLGRITVAIAREPLRTTQVMDLAQTQIGQPPIAGKLGNTTNAKLRRNTQGAGCRRRAGGVFRPYPKRTSLIRVGVKTWV